MTEKFKGKYRIPSARHPHWDYRNEGAYFITICTKRRIPYFGEIVSGTMNLSPVGAIADVIWEMIPHHFPGVLLGSYIVMPDHFHGILELPVPDSSDDDKNKDDPRDHPISPKAGSVSTIIRSYKSAVTRHSRRLGFGFAWQARFYDHIIRDAEAYKRISQYIQNNPQDWKDWGAAL